MPPSERLQKLYRGSEALALEIDLSTMMQAFASAYSAIDKDSFYSLREEEQPIILSAIEKGGRIPNDRREVLLKRHLSAVYRALESSKQFSPEGPLTTDVDVFFWQKSKDDGRPVLELEGVRAFADSDRSLRRDLLERKILLASEAVLNDNKAQLWRTLRTELLRIGCSGGVEALYDANYRFYTTTLGLPGEVVTHEIDDRNRLMSDNIARILQERGRVFAIVGMLHLGGPNGIPELLRRRGVAVRRLELQ